MNARKFDWGPVLEIIIIGENGINPPPMPYHLSFHIGPIQYTTILVRTCFVTMGPKDRSPFHHILSRVVGISSHKVNKTFSFHKL